MKTEVKMDSILRKVCGLDSSFNINDEMSPTDIEGWDSLTNVQLIMELESSFNIEFDFEELMSLEKWGDYKDLVKKTVEMTHGS